MFFLFSSAWSLQISNFVYGIDSYCCDRKSRAAYAQSFALWQQATIELTCRNHSIIACSHHIYMVLFFTHIPFMVNIQCNACGEVATISYVVWTYTYIKLWVLFWFWRCFKTNVIVIVIMIILNVIVIDYIVTLFIHNCNRLHLWCNRPMSGHDSFTSSNLNSQ